MEHDPYIHKIAADVLRVLAGKGFFEALDDKMSPAELAKPPFLCEGTYAISTTILTSCGFSPEDIADITQVLASRGGCCDCEILYNVAEESRLKSHYWKARAASNAPSDFPFSHGDFQSGS